MKTIKIKKVLIALDYNPTAQKVAEVGYAFAQSMGAEVSLLHVITNPIDYTSSEHVPIMGFTGFLNEKTGAIQIESVDQLKDASQAFLDKSKNHLGNEDIKTIIKEGELSETILNTAKLVHADVIVMGSHSQKWLENIIMGSVTETVLRHTSIPLLIIPTKKYE